MIKKTIKNTESYVTPECEIINLNFSKVICTSFGYDSDDRQIEDATEGDDWGTL